MARGRTSPWRTVCSARKAKAARRTWESRSPATAMVYNDEGPTRLEKRATRPPTDHPRRVGHQPCLERGSSNTSIEYTATLVSEWDRRVDLRVRSARRTSLNGRRDGCERFGDWWRP